MKKVKNIDAYPFIKIVYNVMPFNFSRLIVKTETAERDEKEVYEFINNLNMTEEERKSIDNLVASALETANEEGFINGYLMAVKVLKGEMV